MIIGQYYHKYHFMVQHTGHKSKVADNDVIEKGTSGFNRCRMLICPCCQFTKTTQNQSFSSQLFTNSLWKYVTRIRMQNEIYRFAPSRVTAVFPSSWTVCMTSFVRGNDGIFLYASRACLAKYAWIMPFSIEHKNKDARKMEVNCLMYRI